MTTSTFAVRSDGGRVVRAIVRHHQHAITWTQLRLNVRKSRKQIYAFIVSRYQNGNASFAVPKRRRVLVLRTRDCGKDLNEEYGDRKSDKGGQEGQRN